MSAAAKGRSGGSGGSSGISIDDGWYAPPQTKAQMAFQVIFGIASFVFVGIVLKFLHKVPTLATKGPYLFFAGIALFSGIGYIMTAVRNRLLYEMDLQPALDLGNASNFFLSVAISLRYAVIVWIIHHRSDMLALSKGMAGKPINSQIWKKILDWLFISVLFIIYITLMGLNAGVSNGSFADRAKSRNALSHAITAFLMIVAINVIASLIGALAASNRASTKDGVIRRLLFISAPFVAVYAILDLFLEVWTYTVDVEILVNSSLDRALASTIISGICWIGISIGIILTMNVWHAETMSSHAQQPYVPNQSYAPPMAPAQPWGGYNNNMTQVYSPYGQQAQSYQQAQQFYQAPPQQFTPPSQSQTLHQWSPQSQSQMLSHHSPPPQPPPQPAQAYSIPLNAGQRQ